MSRIVFAALVTTLGLFPVSALAAEPAHPNTTGEWRLLVPQYPADRNCSPLTSLFGSWDDVDGTRREEAHTGVDGGRLGEPILAPAAGVVIGVWRANWGWGQEGALLIRHTKADLGLSEGPDFYYSEFDHLRYRDIRSIAVGTKVARGERIATVSRPGGNGDYQPEVHWEVASIEDDDATQWSRNKFGGKSWKNDTGHLVNPLQMLSLNAAPREDGGVDIPVFEPGRDYRSFRGFTYILPCPKKPKAGKKPAR